ncbi:MAG TPA: polysaccharide biosynthesis C-terminal domain-containing protein [Bacteroidia bacterium]|nr:polysaccharide biosynthesis C-terminal domain-containing protein [Bacteroidia bacterium]
MFKNILHSLLTKGLVAVINFFLLIVSARYLVVSSRGEISIFVLNLTIIQIVNEVYTGYTLIYFIPKFDLKKLFISGIIYSLIFSSLSNAIIVFLNRQVQGFEWLGYFISLLIIINTFNCVLILGKEKVKRYNFLNLLQPLLLLIGLAFYIVVLKEFTFRAYLFPLLFSFVVAILISGFTVFEIIRHEKAGKIFNVKPILVNGFLCQAGILMHIFCNRYSYYLFSTNAQVGLYSSASSLIESVLIIANGISPVLLARVANQGNTQKSTEITLSLSKASLLFSLLAVAVIFLLPEDFFVYVLGSGFTGTKQLMVLYAPGILMISLFSIITNYFSAIGRLNVVLLCNSFGFVVTLALAPVLITKYNIPGAAYTANIAYLVIAVTVYFSFFKISKLPLRRLFSLKQDYKNIKELIVSKND